MSVDPNFEFLSKRLNLRFKNEALLKEALTHASYSNKPTLKTYERLEFLGDRVLGLVIAELLYKKFPQVDEGELARHHTALVRAETCAAVAENLQLGDDMFLGEGEMHSGGRSKQALLADVCEAIIGAIYLDQGLHVAAEFIERNWLSFVDNPPQKLRDPKTELQEWAQGRGLPLPSYHLVERTGPDHEPEFVIEVNVKTLPAAQGRGASKRIAEQAAAQLLLNSPQLTKTRGGKS